MMVKNVQDITAAVIFKGSFLLFLAILSYFPFLFFCIRVVIRAGCGQQLQKKEREANRDTTSVRGILHFEIHKPIKDQKQDGV